MGMTRILIADDHDVVRTGLRTILEAQPGWEVVGDVANGRDAIEQAVATRPDVAVLDYGLPLVNGIEVTRQIRARVPGIEVLIFTMHDTDDLIREALEAVPGAFAEIRRQKFSDRGRGVSCRPQSLLHWESLGGSAGELSLEDHSGRQSSDGA